MRKGSEHNLTSTHARKLGNDKGVFKNFPIREYMDIPYPNNVETNKEILYLNSLPTKSNIKFILNADDSVKYFEKKLKDIGLNINIRENDKLKGLLRNIAPFIISLKHHYDRPRPNEVSNVDYVWLKSAQSPAYPSGHSTQSRFIALYLSDKYPRYQREIIKLGENIGISRLMAKIHYPSDHIFGKNLGSDLYSHYQKYTPLNKQ